VFNYYVVFNFYVRYVMGHSASRADVNRAPWVNSSEETPLPIASAKLEVHPSYTH
jgi:hypothetical protein